MKLYLGYSLKMLQLGFSLLLRRPMRNCIEIIKEVKKITWYGALINTSFNKHGRTIVNTPEDAIIDFIDIDLDFLFMNGFLINRN